MSAQDQLNFRGLDPAVVTGFKLLQRYHRDETMNKTLARLVSNAVTVRQEGIERMIAEVD